MNIPNVLNGGWLLSGEQSTYPCGTRTAENGGRKSGAIQLKVRGTVQGQ